METDSAPRLMLIVAPYGKGDEIIAELNALGVANTAAMMGKGTAKQTWLHILGVSDVTKDVVVTFLTKDAVEGVFAMLKQRFKAGEKGGCAAFTIRINSVAGADTLALLCNREDA